MSFGIRNAVDPNSVFNETYRVLKQGGQAIFLEFSLPRIKWVRAFYLFYLRHVIPLIGAISTRNRSAYTYLNATIETFPYGKNFCDLFEKAGFVNISYLPLTLGVATIYIGYKQ
jgi:demethylmenaquinone methyltransferase/2-methoxy-6-polyprenyl-1,4-benzoquinol methylase